MYHINKIPAMLIAALMCLSLASCKSKTASSEEQNPKSTVKPPVAAQESSSEPEPQPQEQEDHIGQKLRAVYDIFKSDKYTFKCTLLSNENDDKVQIERYKSGSKLYQSQQTDKGKRGFLADGEKVYEFDYLTYSYTDEGKVLPDIIESVVDENLVQSSSHIDAKKGETAEEYTYMGDTFITVYDFYFNEKDDSLVRYTATYSVEGNDDVIESRTVDELTSSVGDESVFEASFVTTLTNFSAFSQADRKTYCSDICTRFGITEQMLVSNGMTSESFRKISYSDFLGLVYRYSSESGAAKKQ